jgi:hypothetical protein
VCAAVGGSAAVRQWGSAAVSVAVHAAMCSIAPVWQCAAVQKCAAVCGSARGSVRGSARGISLQQCGSARGISLQQCGSAAVCGNAAACAAVCGGVGSGVFLLLFNKYIRLNLS